MVKHIPNMVDMSLDRQDKMEMAMPSPPNYPYGLCISLCERELEKLSIDPEEIGNGDMLHLHCLARVSSKSTSDNDDGLHCRVELQIMFIAAEDEDEENEESDKVTKLYSNKR